MADRKPHLLVNGVGSREDFQSRNLGRSLKVALQNRHQHGTALGQQYANVLARHEARQAEPLVPITDETGVYVEVVGFSGIELPLEKLDNRDFKLCSCRKQGDHEVATVFIPESRRDAFNQKLHWYLTKDTDKGMPRNQALIDSIAEIKLADLRSFWTDAQELFPEAADQPVWWELWLKKRATDLSASEVAAQLAERLDAELSNTSLSFFDSFVILIKASVDQLESAPELIANLEELRRAKQTPNAFISMPAKEQHEWASELADRIRLDESTTTAITVLDTGVNFHHPLLSQVTTQQLAQAWESSWPLYDDYQPTYPLAPYNDHGSRQAGLAALGELDESLLATHEIWLTYRIESGRILPPAGNNDPELYGAITVGTAAKLEIDNLEFSRVYSLAVTSPADSISGQPSSWSAEIDQFAFGLEDDLQRLFVISAGNNQSLYATVDVWEQLYLAEIEDPAQAWNALTVGAYTEKTTNDDASFAGWAPFAKSGDVAPASRSSVNWGWQKQAPYKPDVVAEGGNRLLSPDGTEVSDADVVSLLTTSGRTSGQLFETTKDTSAACALVSRQAALLMAEYPDYWPETIRGLIVHSAEWTPRMWERFGLLQKGQKYSNAARTMLRCVGHGVPSLERARYSANNALTLIVQDTLQPFKKPSAKASDNPKMNEMQLYQLPWPVEELRKLPPELDIKLRVTLSYFIEPNPGRRGYRQRYSYQSHGLRFKVINPGQPIINFRAAINKIANDTVEDYQGVEGDKGGWLFGTNLKTFGSLHSDTWTGSAADLADMHTLAVYPVGGWWKYRAGEERWQNRVRFSLIVSIDVPDSEVDIYSEVENLIETSVQVET
ncbi:S8 family peptidase [Vreelandella titanicae]|uniref:S8 family peptidase n=1 Tax=Vreelandella titanicae TaxID=664683 RepID=UPI001593BF17|nr:S8 family peptidase [Halomonas titanicae]NVE89248.1 S8 family peptidase [Halomonas titanicae]